MIHSAKTRSVKRSISSFKKTRRRSRAPTVPASCSRSSVGPATREERTALYRAIDRRARQIDYRWAWRGPVIPELKPPFKGMFVDQSGRIWVRLHQPAEPIESAAEESAAEESAAEGVENTWREPIVFDVFEPGGRYLGQVHAPSGFRSLPQPVIQGDMVWAVVAEPGESPNVVRFLIDH